MHKVIKGRTAYSQQFGGFAEIAIDAPQDAQQRVLLRFFTNLAQIEDRHRAFGRVQADIDSTYRRSVNHDHCALDHVLQFTDVAGPGMSLDRMDGVGEECHAAPPLFGRILVHEAVRQQRRIAPTRTQGRDLNDNFSEAIIEVFAELRQSDLVFQALVRWAYDT